MEFCCVIYCYFFSLSSSSFCSFWTKKNSSSSFGSFQHRQLGWKFLSSTSCDDGSFLKYPRWTPSSTSPPGTTTTIEQNKSSKVEWWKIFFFNHSESNLSTVLKSPKKTFIKPITGYQSNVLPYSCRKKIFYLIGTHFFSLANSVRLCTLANNFVPPKQEKNRFNKNGTKKKIPITIFSSFLEQQTEIPSIKPMGQITTIINVKQRNIFSMAWLCVCVCVCWE